MSKILKNTVEIEPQPIPVDYGNIRKIKSGLPAIQCKNKTCLAIGNET